MQTTFKFTHAIVFGASLSLAQCERKAADETQLENDCNTLCEVLASSDQVIDTVCTEQCVDGFADAQAVGESCAEAYTALTTCFGALKDYEAESWWSNRRLGHSAMYDYPCEDETEEFLVACPNVWYNEMMP